MGRRSEHTREQLRTLIVDATMELVQLHGAEHVTARQIAQQIGYTPGMLYSVFINLEDIHLHVNVKSLQQLVQSCRLATQSGTNAGDRIMQMGLCYLEFAENKPHLFSLMFKPLPSSDKLLAPANMRELINEVFALVEKELQQLAPQKSASDVRIGARALWSGVHGTASLASSRQFYLDTAHADRVVAYVLVTGFLHCWQHQEP